MSVSGQDRKQVVAAASSVYQLATATANGTTYVQLISSTSAAILITHVFRSFPTTQNMAAGTVTLATGAAASEVAILTFQHPYTNDTQLYLYTLPYPIRVTSGTRVAMKGTQADTATLFGINYVNESAVV